MACLGVHASDFPHEIKKTRVINTKKGSREKAEGMGKRERRDEINIRCLGGPTHG